MRLTKRQRELIPETRWSITKKAVAPHTHTHTHTHTYTHTHTLARPRSARHSCILIWLLIYRDTDWSASVPTTLAWPCDYDDGALWVTSVRCIAGLLRQTRPPTFRSRAAIVPSAQHDSVSAVRARPWSAGWWSSLALPYIATVCTEQGAHFAVHHHIDAAGRAKMKWFLQ